MRDVAATGPGRHQKPDIIPPGSHAVSRPSTPDPDGSSRGGKPPHSARNSSRCLLVKGAQDLAPKAPKASPAAGGAGPGPPERRPVCRSYTLEVRPGGARRARSLELDCPQ